MKNFFVTIIIAVVFLWLQAGSLVLAADINGLWTKTTSADPNNITIFYCEQQTVRAIGYSTLQGNIIVWYATGEINQSRMLLAYHYSVDAIPEGWGANGRMELTIAADGNTISGVAISNSGSWSGGIEFKRIRIISQQTE